MSTKYNFRNFLRFFYTSTGTFLNRPPQVAIKVICFDKNRSFTYYKGKNFPTELAMHLAACESDTNGIF